MVFLMILNASFICAIVTSVIKPVTTAIKMPSGTPMRIIYLNLTLP